MSGHRRGRVVGAGTVVGAFLAFGVAPLASAPTARADEFAWIDDLFDPSAWQALTVGTAPATGDPTDWAALFDQWIYQPIHDVGQDWIASTFGAQVDAAINQYLGPLFGTDLLIGNGLAGTQADPTGGAGGLWFGDGGAGWDSTVDGVAGGNGGAAFFGDGGDGGLGGAGADGGSGGDTGFGIAA